MNITDIEASLSTHMIDGEIWFIGAEVCALIEVNKSQLRRLDADEKILEKVKTKGGHQATTLINESGFYHLILTSKAEKAVKFRRLITREFLPKIRKMYQFQPESIANFIEVASGKKLINFEKNLINGLFKDTQDNLTMLESNSFTFADE